MTDDRLLGLRSGLHAFSHHYRRWALLDSSKAAAGLLALPRVEPELHPASVTKAPVLITRASCVVIVPMSQNGGTTRPDIELIESTNDSSVPTLKSWRIILPMGGCLGHAGPEHQIVAKRPCLNNDAGRILRARCTIASGLLPRRGGCPYVQAMKLELRQMFNWRRPL